MRNARLRRAGIRRDDADLLRCRHMFRALWSVHTMMIVHQESLEAMSHAPELE